MTEQTADSFEVSPQQEELWLAEPDGPSGRVQAIVELVGGVDPEALRGAVARTIERHEILRTTFAHQPGIRVPVQAVAGDVEPVFSTVDLTGPDADSAVQKHAEAELAYPLDLSQGSLLRALLITRGPDRHSLILTVSTLCADASSIALLVQELLQHYAGATPTVEDPLQYADFSAWQRELEGADDEEATAARDFWSATSDAVGPTLPFAERPDAGTEDAASSETPVQQVPVTVDGATVSSIIEQASRYGATPAELVHAAWHAVIGASTGEEDVTLAFVSSERRHADLEGALGTFARAVPVRSRVDPQITFAELMLALRAATDEAAVWQDYAPAGATAGLRIGFVSVPAFDQRIGELDASLGGVVLATPGMGLWLTAAADARTLTLSVQYDALTVNAEMAALLARRLGAMLHSVAADAGAALGKLTILDEDERRQLLVEFNRSGPAVTDGSVTELISAHALTAPERAAVVDESGSLSYGDLERRANQLAHRLQRAGVGPEVGVGLCTDRSADMIVGLLGILKAGGAYVPLHYEHPAARLGHQLETAGARAIVTQEALLERLPEFAGDVICLDRDRSELEGEDTSAPGVQIGPENLVYVVYTSGSTGVPKGVGVTHGNVVNYATDIIRQLGAGAEPLSFGAVTSISTDLGNTSVFGALCSGGTLVLFSPVAAADAAAFAAQARRTPIDVLKITPSHLGALIAGGDGEVLPRRRLVIGGERATWDLVERVRALSDVPILNHYGPTEATIGCCTFEVGDEAQEYRPVTVPIGRPIAGDSSYVLGSVGQPVPLGAPGRLHIGGAGVARGYVGAPELTAERFLDDPFLDGARMYDTGDLARWLPNGTLEFLGRIDEQVKIRGYRVEPAEVESALRAHDGVREAVVLAVPGPAGDLRLVAYCTLETDVPVPELKAHLAQWLPEFMLPSAIVVLDALPVTPSGKIDRLALPDPDQAGEAPAEYVAPRTPVEQAMTEIWSRVLGIDKLGVEEDFFALGGHSLLATQVVAHVRSDFAVDLPLHSLFTYPTVASLSAEIVRMMGDSEDAETARLMSELEGLSDEEAERLLASEPQTDTGPQH